jgi:polyisoprenoid-binding protein YceI
METTLKKEATKTKWTLDPSHSELAFKVRHMMITNVKGEFKDFDATLVSQGTDFSKSDINVTIYVASLSTDHDQRDAHLRSAGFFEADKFPTLSFKGTSFINIDGDEYKLKGILEIKGVRKK